MAKDKILKCDINGKKYIKNKNVARDRNYLTIFIIAYVFFIYGSIIFLDYLSNLVNPEGSIASMYVTLAAVFIYLMTLFCSWIIIMTILKLFNAFKYREIK